MHEKYTQKAKEVLKRAKEAAGTLGNEYVGTEHILLGLTWCRKALPQRHWKPRM